MGSVDLKLANDEVAYLEELYMAYDLVGVMADNKASAGDSEKAWQKHTKNRI